MSLFQILSLVAYMPLFFQGASASPIVRARQASSSDVCDTSTGLAILNVVVVPATVTLAPGETTPAALSPAVSDTTTSPGCLPTTTVLIDTILSTSTSSTYSSSSSPTATPTPDFCTNLPAFDIYIENPGATYGNITSLQCTDVKCDDVVLFQAPTMAEATKFCLNETSGLVIDSTNGYIATTPNALNSQYAAAVVWSPPTSLQSGYTPLDCEFQTSTDPTSLSCGYVNGDVEFGLCYTNYLYAAKAGSNWAGGSQGGGRGLQCRPVDVNYVSV